MITKLNPLKSKKINLNFSKPVVIWISFLVIFFFGLVVIENIFDRAYEIDDTGANSTSSFIFLGMLSF